MTMTDYKHKYQKYKTKYLLLIANQEGGVKKKSKNTAPARIAPERLGNPFTISPLLFAYLLEIFHLRAKCT